MLFRSAIEGIQSHILLQKLSDRQINSFVQTIGESLAQDTLTQRDCGLIAFVPKTWAGMQARQERQETVATLSTSSQYLGRVGDKVRVDFVMLDKRFLQQYNCWSVNGHDSNGNLVNFLTAHEHLAKSGSIQGKIKRTEVSQYHNGAQVTQLNFVKAV